MSGAETHPFHAVHTEQSRTAPTGRGKSSVCRMMSVFGEDGGGDGGVEESEKRGGCVGEET